MDFEQILGLMKPEHADVIRKAFADKDADLATANATIAEQVTQLETANSDLAKAKAALETPPAEPSEDDIIKGMPEHARALFEKMRAQKEAAEERVRKEAAEKAEAAAIAKAASLKAIPVPQETLVGILKSCTPEIADLLTTINTAIEATVLSEVGKSAGNGASTAAPSTSNQAWDKLEKRAAEVATRDGITKEKAMSVVLDENPELYHEYLNGGAK